MFSDYDLHKVKEEINAMNGNVAMIGIREHVHVLPETLASLITRLEAAEKVCEQFSHLVLTGDALTQ